MNKLKLTTLFLLLVISFQAIPNANRLKDLVSIKGVQENAIVGYGIVIGLNGTGDSSNEIVTSSFQRLFKKLGLNLQKQLESKNIAAVVVTATLPPFARLGQKLDVTISAVGDSGSLAGGTLLVTPLKGGDNNIYAIASGQLLIGRKATNSFKTTAKILNGAVVEKELDLQFDQKTALRLALNNPDFTTAARIEKIINSELGGKFASAKDATTIDLIIPPNYQRNVVQLVAIMENFRIIADQKAKVVINERTGTIVAGGDIILKPVAISHGDLTIEIASEKEEKKDKGKGSTNTMYYMQDGATLQSLVKGLNALGATPDDLMAIFQALKKNGALIADIEVI